MNNSEIWLKAILIEGDRLLVNNNENEKLMCGLFKTDRQILWDNTQKRIIFEYTFSLVVNKAINWLKEMRKTDSSKKQEIDEFLSHMPTAKEVRDMLEHDIDYLNNEGNKQKRFVHNIKKKGLKIKLDTSTPLILSDNYLIGGKLDVLKTIKKTEELLAKIGK